MEVIIKNMSALELVTNSLSASQIWSETFFL